MNRFLIIVCLLITSAGIVATGSHPHQTGPASTNPVATALGTDFIT